MIAVAAVALLLFGSLDDPTLRLKQAFQGTVISTYPDGRTALLWLEPDGSYRALGRRRKPSSGTWTLRAERIFLKQMKPFGAPFAFCSPMPEGGTLTTRAVTGEQIVVTLSPGGRDGRSDKAGAR